MSAARPRNRRRRRSGGNGKQASQDPAQRKQDFAPPITSSSVTQSFRQFPPGEVNKVLLSLLCQLDGQATLECLLQYIQQYFVCLGGKSGILGVLSRDPEHFALEPIRGDYIVTASTDLQLCLDHCTEIGCLFKRCDGLHLCKFFIISTCNTQKQGKPDACEFGHDLLTPHNQRLLTAHGLQHLDIDQLRCLLKVNRCQATLPMVCSFYNVGRGCRHAGGLGCPGMHVCGPYVEGWCKFGRNCKRSHNIFDMQPKWILQQYGMDLKRSPKEVLSELRGYQKKIFPPFSKKTWSVVSSRGSRVQAEPHPSTLQQEGPAAQNLLNRPKMAAKFPARPQRSFSTFSSRD